VFLTHNFGYRCASKSIKGSIDADFDQVFNKTLSQKNGSIGWGPRLAKISKTFPLCDVTFRKPPTKTENCFFRLSIRLAKSVESLNSSLALAAGDLWPKKGRPIAVVKGLNPKAKPYEPKP